jgi:sec-independent protein translocase protein TatB
MSFSETIFLFFLALVIFGPKKLPEIARQAGKWLNEFKRASNEFRSQIEQEIAHLEVDNKQTILPPSEPPSGATSRSTYAGAEIEAPAEVPALTAAASGDGFNLDEAAAGEAPLTPASPASVTPEQASPTGPSSATPASSEDVTASDAVGAAAASDSRRSLSHAPESHA